MKNHKLLEFIQKPQTNKILKSFITAKRVSSVEAELNIKRINIKKFVSLDLLRCICQKGKGYILTNKARKLLKMSAQIKCKELESLIWFVKSSPKQRLVILKVMNAGRRLSENIRFRAKMHRSPQGIEEKLASS